MKNMKKLWAALLALAMTFSLAACGGTLTRTPPLMTSHRGRSLR